ncbi:ectonucleoside triphosphate diphosphohydrolase 6 isoform X1 [Pelodiscus sinensis]|uniref:ectonucleoside triphosphate diphosphohydrolase 6 isoform X1 n=1 Tax=Pelodiscus sinensis TaxID=13735 RepID=UPI000D7212E1|nr:ectonucleoside triphosphate diphosphohydrolase 6 isoform X1 [Pelodiscus sinensis]|eukprot:XP_025034124.1 ectonucleoside triphosphate diphosphohydrolase 6 isoform X1 [Pelodiscus sinensis]
MEAMKISKPFYGLGIFACVAIYVVYIKWHLDSKPVSSVTDGTTDSRREKLDHEKLTTDHTEFYGIMFDAGSTGTRIHIFKFTQKSKETPKLTHETFKALKPGLSAYADDVDKSAQGIQELLEVAKNEVPVELWTFTPLVLKATAGLRLLPGEKAKKLLNKVRDLFQESPFFVRDDCVSVMNGTDEGISAWITINFLTGSLSTPRKRSVGMLDLGGGSTQMTFLPISETTLQKSPAGHITSFQMFNTTYKLYSYSYLGLGLMSARLAILGGVEGRALKEGEVLMSPCLSPGFQWEWEHAEIVYRVKGQKAGGNASGDPSSVLGREGVGAPVFPCMVCHFTSSSHSAGKPGGPLYESCASKVAELLSKKVHKTEVKGLEFYAFSYYYDCAAEVGLIDKEKGGTLTVSDFEIAAQYVCKTMEVKPGDNPFLCLDLTYISLLLQELGFPKSQVFQLARKIDNVETSWALGATFHYLDTLHRLQY